MTTQECCSRGRNVCDTTTSGIQQCCETGADCDDEVKQCCEADENGIYPPVLTEKDIMNCMEIKKEEGVCQYKGYKCSDNQICDGGECTCKEGQELCGDDCYDVCVGGQVRNANCECECPDEKPDLCGGTCREACPDGQTRDETTCECKCPDGQELCGDDCYDVCDGGRVRNASCECECPAEMPTKCGNVCCVSGCNSTNDGCGCTSDGDCPTGQGCVSGDCYPDSCAQLIKSECEDALNNGYQECKFVIERIEEYGEDNEYGMPPGTDIIGWIRGWTDDEWGWQDVRPSGCFIPK